MATAEREGKLILCAYSLKDKKAFETIKSRLYNFADGFVLIPFQDGEAHKRKIWLELIDQGIQASAGTLLLLSRGFFSSPPLTECLSVVQRSGHPHFALALDDVPLPPFIEPAAFYPGLPFFKLPPVRRNQAIEKVAESLLAMVGIPSGAPNLEAAETLSLPAPLLKASVTGQLVFFAGPGMSEMAGMPNVTQIAERAITWPDLMTRFSPHLRESLRSLVRERKGDLALEGIVETVEKESPVIVNFFKNVLRDAKPAPTPAHSILRELNLSGAMTPNYDQLLEQSLGVNPEAVQTPKDAERLLAALSKKEFFALKLFGALSRPETLLFTPARYRDSVAGNVAFGQFLSALYFSRTLLFAGTSLDWIEDFLVSIPSRGEQPTHHFAVIQNSETGWQVKASTLRRRFGLELVVLPDSGSPLIVFLKRLAREVKTLLKREGRLHPDAERGDRLASVTVENIGPFESQKVDLHGDWNLLLGDNGVGKSFILKAIAASLVGEEAGPTARRLIRVGKTSASVTLVTTRGEKYHTEILATESGARVQSIPTRPLEKEGWLAIGFPPLRTVSWERPKPYEAQERGRADSRDLLPLIRGEADPRLDGLKAWLLYLDHSIHAPSKGQEAHSELHQRLWNKFFEVVRKATPGMTLGEARVDAARRQVLIKTDDGEVPIEAVSQGTQSLMGWIGVVLQRLFEVYDQDEDPTQRYALILMDEIDAHMHPQWQQALVTNLREIFPKAQFVATSHSPLVVAGLSKDEVWIFRRDGSLGRRVSVTRPLEDFKGWRVDQILTSPSFGLAGARDKETVDLMAQYNELVSKFEPTEEERRKLKELAGELQVTVPPPQSLPQAREASKMIEQAFQQKLSAMEPEERKKLIEELRAQVQEAVTGARRPS